MMALQEGQWQIRDLVIGAGTTYRLMDASDPFDLVVRADQGGPRAWNHGNWSGAEWASERVVPLRILVRDEAALTVVGWREARHTLAAAFAPVGDTGEQVELRFVIGGTEYVLLGRPRMVEFDTSLIGTGQSFVNAAFVAQDPRIYAGLESTTQTGLPVQSGGLLVPGTVAARGTPPYGLVLTGAAGDYASTPDDAALDITGTIVLAADVTLTSWNTGSTQALVPKYAGGTPGQRSYRLVINAAGFPELAWSTDGETSGLSTVASANPLNLADGQRQAIVARLETDVAGDHTVTFYTAPTLPDVLSTGTLSVLDFAAQPGTTSIHSGTADLVIGAFLDGTVHEVRVIDGNLGGTVVANPDFTRQDNGATSFTDIVGRLWSVNGNASISGITPGPGGLLIPFTVDGVLTGGSATLLNEGTTDTALTLRIDGPVIEPTVVVQQPGGDIQRIRFNLALAAGQWLDINTATRTALLNGLPQANQRGRAIWDIDPYPLQPGTSTLRYLAGSFNETTEITATWRSAWW